MFTYQNLIVWQKAKQLAVEAYKVTEHFPPSEQYGLTSQIRRSAVSIPSNIAEGRLRGYKKDFQKFLRIAFGSAGELQTQILIVKELPKTKNLDYSKVDSLLDEVMKILYTMIKNGHE